MNIGIVCYPSYGGSGVVGTELAMALARRGHRVHLISYEPPVRYLPTDLPVTLHAVDVPQYPLFKYPPYLLALANKIVEVARYQHLDVLHVHYAIPHATAGLLAKQMLGGRLPLVTTLHGTDITLLGADPSFYDVIEYSMNESDALTAVSDALRRETMQRFRLRRPVELVYNFVDPEIYSPHARRRCPAPRPADRAVVVHVSNFRAVKRVPLVVEVFARAAADLDAELWLVGDGPDSAEARRRAAVLGVGERVRFWGQQDNPAAWIASGDVMLLPSAQEAFGLAALEAMACGLPVVASRVGGLPEVVSDGETGLLFDPDDVQGMVAGLRSLLLDPARRRTLGEAGRRRAVKQFACRHVVPRYEEIYRRAMARDPNTARQDVVD
ncbi:MAG: N-acetyl-alpha-D-glucosaminyl L-malate synthase BshA [Bacillota bacterium]|nr:MAG: N-acetyl-alpha-D-glucosaminyl L-malate synthase BshA [Bacillota bacterium]